MTTIARSPAFWFGAVIGIGLAVAELVGSGEGWRALVSGGIPIAYAALYAALAVVMATAYAGSLLVLRARH